VIEFAGAFNEGLLKTGILSCGKHFPGYAAATLDPHHELPRIDRTREELEKTELAIFREFAPRVSSMMVCHAWYPAFDREKTPASFSRSIVTDLLVSELGFDGLIMTDDLDMGAIINETGLTEMMESAMLAGNHLAMICHRVHLVKEALAALEGVERAALDRALSGVDRFKRKLATPTPFSAERFYALDNRVWELRVATLGADAAALRSPDDGKRSPVELY
jgi:beta-N-acetylhexosaminidase